MSALTPVLVRDAALDARLSDLLSVTLHLVLAEVPRGVSERTFAREAMLLACEEWECSPPSSWPQPQLSCSHTRTHVALLHAPSPLAGLGLDVEDAARALDARAARFFLTEREQQVGGDLLTLWTLKEALYKADPGNASRHLGCYELEDPAAPRGEARLLDGARRFSYLTTQDPALPNLRLAVALTREDFL